ncbi:hypothetical protein ACP4OV_022050 [Aristida adscensionis]
MLEKESYVKVFREPNVTGNARKWKSISAIFDKHTCSIRPCPSTANPPPPPTAPATAEAEAGRAADQRTKVRPWRLLLPSIPLPHISLFLSTTFRRPQSQRARSAKLSCPFLPAITHRRRRQRPVPEASAAPACVAPPIGLILASPKALTSPPSLLSSDCPQTPNHPADPWWTEWTYFRCHPSVGAKVLQD